MKISYIEKKISASNFVISLGNKNLNIFLNKNSITLDIDNFKIFLEGQFYYSFEKEKYNKITESNLSQLITSLIKNYGIMSLSKHLEGAYLCCWIDCSNLKAGFFGDAFNSVKTYYSSKKENIEISTEVEDLILPENGYDQMSLYSYMMLGYPADCDTFYSGVKKLGSDEYFLFTSESFKKNRLERFPKKIEEFNKSELDKYDEIFENSITSRATGHNIVMNSGGWDSTSIISKLSKTQGTDSLSSSVFEVLIPDGQSFNSYEVDKVKRISKFFKIDTDVATIDYNDNSLIEYWESRTEYLKKNHTYFWLHHLKIADKIGLNANSDTRVFNGEGSDSIHNFGFSQFVSVNYNDMQLRAIADKGKSYLYSPSFLESFSKNQIAEDKVLNFFQNYYGKENFENVCE